jgi:hypothetical protein
MVAVLLAEIEFAPFAGAGERAGGSATPRLAAARARRLCLPARGGLGEIGRIYV